MYCRFCGSKLKESAKFCEECGAPVNEVLNKKRYDNIIQLALTLAIIAVTIAIVVVLILYLRSRDETNDAPSSNYTESVVADSPAPTIEAAPITTPMLVSTPEPTPRPTPTASPTFTAASDMFSIGDTITANGYSIEIESIEFIDTLNPEKVVAGSLRSYRSFSAQSGYTYLCLSITLQLNPQEISLLYDELPKAYCSFDDETIYESHVVFDEHFGLDLSDYRTSITSVIPQKIYYLMEVPDGLENEGFTITLCVDNKNYSFSSLE